MEANEARRETYRELINSLPEEDLVYLDESGIEEGICKEHAWSPIGYPVPGKRSGQSCKRVNIIGALNQSKLLAPFTFYGSCNTNIFNLWLEKVLIPELEPGKVIILDNASFHKSERTKKIIEEAGCRVIFLPPYSPDLNPIEKFWAKMKKWIRNRRLNLETLQQAISNFFASNTC